ncbi:MULTISPECIES: hypothetical protein [unclassified Streptomyces]|uniref:hypothetical protein n=1 Tax=unclassified Streptomyces TaxID=2593676 RepID=UPI0016618AB5|nr:MULTISPECIES: hypothetical protein [unclassified Streptomyces]MBD0839240.1 hypothetical protein [Streptomyces sp. TRM68416]
MAETRRRLRSSTVVLGGMGVVAAALTSCSSEPDRRCVDRDSYTWDGYKVIADHNCSSGASGSSYGGGGRKTGGTDAAWYYDADVKGGRAEYGTFSRSTAVDRGGFGCSASRSSGS